MATECAPIYACLTVRYLEETKLFINELAKYFNESECKLIVELLKRYMDDGFIFWSLKLTFENFKTCLNNIHPSIKFPFENPKTIYENKMKVHNFTRKQLSWNWYLLQTNEYSDYLPYDSAHPDHTKNNISYKLAKRILAFVSNPEKVIISLAELRQFLKECKHPEYVISERIFNAKIQGPASKPERSKNVILFVTAYYPNIDNKSLMQIVKNKFKIISNEHLKSVYKDANFILCLNKPKNLYR